MSGAPLFGTLEVAGIGEPSFAERIAEAVVDQGECYRHNLALVTALVEDEHAEELFRSALRWLEMTCITPFPSSAG